MARRTRTRPASAALRRHAEADPERVALVCDGVETTFGALDARSTRLAHAFAARGVGHGDFVTIALRNGPDAVDDPWDGQTIEWATTSPAPADNFVDVPIVHSAEPNLDLKTPVGVGSDT